MKAGIGNIWITGLVITFMLIFSGYLAVTISYSSAIKDKNYVLSIIEKKNGITRKSGSRTTTVLKVRPRNAEIFTGFGTLESINLFLRGSSYKQQGSCGEGVGDANGGGVADRAEWYGVTELYKNANAINNDGSVHVKVEKVANHPNKKYYYCFARMKTRTGPNSPAYYRVRLFYALDLPILDSLVFTIDGKTSIIDKPSPNEINFAHIT